MYVLDTQIPFFECYFIMLPLNYFNTVPLIVQEAGHRGFEITTPIKEEGM